MEGGRDWERRILPGSTPPIICTHREALWGSWLSLEVPLWVTAKQEKYLKSFSVWHLKTAGWIKQQSLIPLFHSLHTLCLWTSLSKTLYCLSLIALHFPQNLGECVFISLLPSSKSPFMTRRGEFKFPRAAAAARCRITTKPKSKVAIWNGNLIGSLETTVLTNKETALVSNLTAMCCLCGKNDCPLKQNAKKQKKTNHISVI